MVVDSSALLAIICDEPEARAFSGVLHRARDPVLPNSAFVECALALAGKRGRDGSARLTTTVRTLGLRRIAVDDALADAASSACRALADGSSPARLDASGCVSYALARTLERPLLFKGGDFLRTDVAVAC